MDDRRQELAETQLHLEHEARMKELESKKIEVGTRAKEVDTSTLMLQLLLDQSKRVLSEWVQNTCVNVDNAKIRAYRWTLQLQQQEIFGRFWRQ